MNIGSINYGMAASYGAYQQKLTQETKNKLEEYGIAYNKNINEQQAKALIQKYESNKQSFQNNDPNSLLKRAQELAKKLGISYHEGMSFEELLILIEESLKQKISANENNVEELKKLKGLSQELASIQAQSKGSSGYDNSNQALMASLELLSEYNKNFLNK